jgi:hypothetical protein
VSPFPKCRVSPNEPQQPSCYYWHLNKTPCRRPGPFRISLHL